MLPNKIHYQQIKTTMKTINGTTGQDKSVPGNSVDESVVKINEGPTDQDKSVPGNSVDVSCKYRRM